MFDHGVFALPAIYPAVPRGQAVIRTAYMSTHKESQISYVLEILEKLAKKHRIRACDCAQPDSFLEESGFTTTYPGANGTAVNMLGD
jgi:glycine C-acetyltransferase